MDFKEYLQRAELISIENFIRYGGETYRKTSEKTYSERLREANEKITAFFRAVYSNEEEYEKAMAKYGEALDTIEEVFFEVGIIVGAKMGYQLREKAEQLL